MHSADNVSSPLPAPDVIRARHVSKSFSGVRVLNDANIAFRAGEVHAIVGQNGSGKSTLIKILSGYHEPDPGAELFVYGQPVRLPMKQGGPGGIGFMHQDLGLADTMTVLENLRLRSFKTGLLGRILWHAERKATRELLAEFDLQLDPDARIADVPQAERAIIAMLRALLDARHAEGVGALVLDEPTSQLPKAEVNRLFDVIRHAALRGQAVVFVSHRLDEVREIADTVTVLREGRIVGTLERSEATEDRLISLILGRELGSLYPDVLTTVSDLAFEVKGLRGGRVRDLSLEVHSGEVVGLAGLVGSGHEEVPYLICGARRAVEGEVIVHGKGLGLPSPAQAKRAGMVLLPANRPRDSSIPQATVLENVSMPALDRYSPHGYIETRRERAAVVGLLDRFEVRPPDPDRRFTTLSGGNQQKALLAKWLQLGPSVLILHEPTQGVDIGSRKQAFAFVRQAAVEGAAVLFVSAEYEDLAHVCDRVLIMRDGLLRSTLVGSSLTFDRIVEQCYRSN